MSEIEPVSGPAHSKEVQRLQDFETTLMSALDRVGLPSDGVLVEIKQRFRVFENYPNVISELTSERRGESMYLSKLLAAVGAGLFDAALNYLWDETIAELRRRVARYDLAYFFDIAVPSPDRRKGLHDEEHLDQISDQDLIRAAREIGLISDIGYQQLDLTRYMRNYASAAHPNQNEINAFQLLGWIETCIKEVITLPETQVVAETKKLLHNVRAGAITSQNASATAEFFAELSSERADNIAAGFFGIYVDEDSNERARDGVRLLMPHLWFHVTEPKRREFGVKYGKYVANGDTARSERARELLDVVEGAAYLPEPVRAAEISTAIDDLLAAHRGFNNFHTEPGPARRLNRLSSEPVPSAVRDPYVQAVVEAFLTNGNGIAWAADGHYATMISRFDPDKAEVALKQIFDPTVASKLRFDTAQTKFDEMLNAIEPKLTRAAARDLMDAIRSFRGKPHKIAKDSELKRMVKQLR
ncbi:MAG: hypothetical protein OXU42_16185 [Deltaproteobacteria bacterium]|nr:hypothetical protein [Deltaproteobacteria bacterium]